MIRIRIFRVLVDPVLPRVKTALDPLVQYDVPTFRKKRKGGVFIKGEEITLYQWIQAVDNSSLTSGNHLWITWTTSTCPMWIHYPSHVDPED